MLYKTCYSCDHRIVGMKLSAKPMCKMDLQKLIDNTSTCPHWAPRFDAKPVLAEKEKKKK